MKRKKQFISNMVSITNKTGLSSNLRHSWESCLHNKIDEINLKKIIGFLNEIIII